MSTVMRGTAMSLSHPDSGHLKGGSIPGDSPASPGPEGNIVRTRPPRLLRIKQVMELTGMKRTKLYMMQADGSFPMRTQITSGAVGWVEEDVQNWIARRIAVSKPLRVK
jgi:prophage regulatory protein